MRKIILLLVVLMIVLMTVYYVFSWIYGFPANPFAPRMIELGPGQI